MNLSWLSRARIPGEAKKLLNIVKDKKDARDFHIVHAQREERAKRYALPIIAKIKDQGSIGSCASHAIASALEVRREILKVSLQMPLSERWHYYQVRQPAYGNTFPQDAGQSIRDGLKVAYKEGIAPEALCPYDYRKYNEKPTGFANSFAHYFKIESYHRCADIEAMKTAIALNCPVVLGIQCTGAFLVNRDGLISSSPGQTKGGHAIYLEKFDDEKQMFGLVNSWGREWGRGGRAWISYEYVKRYFIDAWAVQ